MRLISVRETIEPIRLQVKTVTRRTGWAWLTPGTLLQPVEKAMGLKKGEKIRKIGCPIEVIQVDREPLRKLLDHPKYGGDEARREGFPKMTGGDFVAFFFEKFGVDPDQPLTRIEFTYRNDLKDGQE